jgi:hypothetical protein
VFKVDYQQCIHLDFNGGETHDMLKANEIRMSAKNGKTPCASVFMLLRLLSRIHGLFAASFITQNIRGRLREPTL